MKTTRLSRHIPWIMVAGLFMVAGLTAGCSDDEDGGGSTGPASTPITVEGILFFPKAVGPSDTLHVTAIVTSESPNVGDFVTYEWSASGGKYLDQGESTVRWSAEGGAPGVYTFTVKATNSVGSASLTDQAFVGQLEPFIDRQAGQMYTIPSNSAVYYTSAPRTAEEGMAVRLKDGAVDEFVFDSDTLGTQFSFDANRTIEAHTYLDSLVYEKITVVYSDLQAKTRKTIGRDERPFVLRWREFTRPAVSPDGQWICYQGALLDPAGPPPAGVDTFAVFVYDVAAQTSRQVTFLGGNSLLASVSNSYYPTISSDNKYVVFISDRRQAAVWEYYALPIEGGEVVADTVDGMPIELSNTGGKITSGDLRPNFVSRSQWNPNPIDPTLASVGADNQLRLVRTVSRQTDLVDDLEGEVADVRWAPSGEFLLAAVTGSDGQTRIYKVPALGGDSQLLWAALRGDRISELSVSSDGEFAVYSNRRGVDIWYELVETNRAPDDPPAVRITAAWKPAGAARYALPLQSVRPVWSPTGRVVYLYFLDEETPRVMSLDLSGGGD